MTTVSVSKEELEKTPGFGSHTTQRLVCKRLGSWGGANGDSETYRRGIVGGLIVGVDPQRESEDPSRSSSSHCEAYLFTN